MDRIRTLLSFLEEDPRDAFLLYSLALEYAKQEDTDSALRYFDRLLDTDPDYYAQYYHRGKLLEDAGKYPEAAEAYRAGIEVAGKANDQHAVGELKTALTILTDYLE